MIFRKILVMAIGILLLVQHVQAASDKMNMAESAVKAKTESPDKEKSAFVSMTHSVTVINWFTIAYGGGQNVSPDYSMSVTVGQPVVGKSGSPLYILNHGFQQNFTIPDNCCDLAGDANADGSVNIGDPVYLINYIFKHGPAPDCMNEGDANADCSVNIGDPVYLINFVFRSGPWPMCGCVE